MAKSGRPKKLNPVGETFYRHYSDPFLSPEQICQKMKISRRTFYRYEAELQLPVLRVGLANYSGLPNAQAKKVQKSPIERYDRLISSKLAQILGLKMKIICVELTAGEQLLRKGEVDILVAGLSFTKSRAKEFYFSESYFSNRPSGNLVSLKDLEFSGVHSKPRLGVVQGSPHEEFALSNLREEFVVKSFDFQPAMIISFQKRELDFLLLNWTTIQALSVHNILKDFHVSKKRYFYDTHTSILFNRDSVDYRAPFNQALAQMREKNQFSQFWEEASLTPPFFEGTQDFSRNSVLSL